MGTLPGRIAAWRERRADLPQDEPGGLDPKHPARRAWREEGGALEAVARDMLRPEDAHAPHLAAMPGERKALVEATSSLESTLLAVKAREKNVLSAVVRRSADELRRDWKAHLAEAGAVRVDPFYVPGHEELIDRLQKLRADPAVEELPERERNQIDSILEQDTRQTKAISHVDNHLAEVQRCRNHLQELQDLAYTYRLKLEKVHSYDEWHDTAERLFAAGKAITDDRKTYGPCLEHHPGAWSGVHAGIRELGTALGRDTTSLHHRHPELYLDPITRPVPDSQQAMDADASYCRLRDQWHTHVALAETSQAHPYHLKGHAALIDAMRELRNLPDLATNAQQALDTLLHDYTPLQQVRQHIHACLDKAEHALEEYQRFKDTVQKLSPLDVGLEDIEGYGEWKDRALRLADAGEAILADPERFSIHLDHRPDDARRIRSSVQRLNDAIGRDEASVSRERHQSLSEDEKTAERLSQRRGIKL